MAEQEKPTGNAKADATNPSVAGSSGASETGGGRRFRLPKLFADSADVVKSAELDASLQEQISSDTSGQNVLDIAERAIALGVSLPATDESVISNANRVFEGSPRASVLRVPLEDMPSPNAPPKKQSRIANNAPSNDAPSNAALTSNIDTQSPQVALSSNAAVSLDDASLPASTSPASTSATDEKGVGVASVPDAVVPEVITPPSEVSARGSDEELTGGQAAILSELRHLRGGMEAMSQALLEMSERGESHDKVFDTLHSELQDYKNDFIYEHLKPVVRPLLFLYDSMEQFDGELEVQTLPQPEERRGLSPYVVRQNVTFFREQLVEALRICEVTPMSRPDGEFDAKLHKAVDTVPVEASEDNTVVRVVRSGWYLNGRVFRHAEVVVGKKTEDANARLWTHGKTA